jgi:hypothetical protein
VLAAAAVSSVLAPLLAAALTAAAP